MAAADDGLSNRAILASLSGFFQKRVVPAKDTNFPFNEIYEGAVAKQSTMTSKRPRKDKDDDSDTNTRKQKHHK